VDEHLAGQASYLRVSLHDDGAVSVEDDGEGIPVAPQAPHGITPLDVALNQLHGRCGWRGTPGHITNNLRGGELAVVNALSSRLEVEICRDGRRYVQEYGAGEAFGPVRDLGATERRGTRITLTPDFSLLRRRRWDRALVARRLRELAALHPRLTIILDHRAFRCPAGLVDLVRFLGRDQRSLHEPVRICGARNEVGVEVALLWTDGARTRVRGFVGDSRAERGTHLQGLADGLFQAFVQLDRARFGTVNRAAFREVLRPGLSAAVQVTLARPRFGSPRRDQLLNPEVRTVVAGGVSEQLCARLRDDPQLRAALLARMPGAARG